MTRQLLNPKESGNRTEGEQRTLPPFQETSSSRTTPVLRLNGLTVQIQQGRRITPIVGDASFTIHPGETLALVGESGSGKSVTAGAILGLLPPSMRVTAGQIVFQGEDIAPWPVKKRRILCGGRIGYVFQDYQGSFTPFIKIGKQMIETIRSHRRLSAKQAKAVALESLDQVGLPAERVFDSYPFQLSGGQLQRAALASTMVLRPAILIADEPTTALDVLTGERVLDVMDRLKRQTGCAVLFISHDLRLVLKRADSVAVMRGGSIVEWGRTNAIRDHARHPYTQMLLKARPSLSEIQAGLVREDEDELVVACKMGGSA